MKVIPMCTDECPGTRLLPRLQGAVTVFPMADTVILNRIGPYRYAKLRRYSRFPMVMNSSALTNTSPCRSVTRFPSDWPSTSGSIFSNWRTTERRAKLLIVSEDSVQNVRFCEVSPAHARASVTDFKNSFLPQNECFLFFLSCQETPKIRLPKLYPLQPFADGVVTPVPTRRPQRTWKSSIGFTARCLRNTSIYH